jgi:hypothetical protein
MKIRAIGVELCERFQKASFDDDHQTYALEASTGIRHAKVIK